MANPGMVSPVKTGHDSLLRTNLDFMQLRLAILVDWGGWVAAQFAEMVNGVPILLYARNNKWIDVDIPLTLLGAEQPAAAASIWLARISI